MRWRGSSPDSPCYNRRGLPALRIDVKHYSFKGVRRPTSPCLLFEVKVDLQDVRSGYRSSATGLFSGQWLGDQEDLHWTEDMVSRLDLQDLKVIDPPIQLEWPSCGDERIIHYLRRYARPRIWKNHNLRMYSGARESKTDFIERCRESLAEERSLKMKKIREIFMHRYFELEQRLKLQIVDEKVDEELKMQRLSRITTHFAQAREQLSRCFVRDDDRLLGEGDLVWRLGSYQDLQDRLNDLRLDLVSAYNELINSCVERATGIETYEVPAPRSAIEIVSRNFLWE